MQMIDMSDVVRFMSVSGRVASRETGRDRQRAPAEHEVKADSEDTGKGGAKQNEGVQ